MHLEVFYHKLKSSDVFIAKYPVFKYFFRERGVQKYTLDK